VLSFWLWPDLARSLGTALAATMFLGMPAMIVTRHWKARKEGKISRAQLIRLIFVDVTGFVLATGISIVAGGLVGRSVGQTLLKTGNSPWLGMLIGMLAGLLLGMGGGWSTLQIWKKITGYLVTDGTRSSQRA
jgi:hypothetical protein